MQILFPGNRTDMSAADMSAFPSTAADFFPVFRPVQDIASHLIDCNNFLPSEPPVNFTDTSISPEKNSRRQSKLGHIRQPLMSAFSGHLSGGLPRPRTRADMSVADMSEFNDTREDMSPGLLGFVRIETLDFMLIYQHIQKKRGREIMLQLLCQLSLEAEVLEAYNFPTLTNHGMKTDFKNLADLICAFSARKYKQR